MSFPRMRRWPPLGCGREKAELALPVLRRRYHPPRSAHNYGGQAFRPGVRDGRCGRRRPARKVGESTARDADDDATRPRPPPRRRPALLAAPLARRPPRAARAPRRRAPRASTPSRPRAPADRAPAARRHGRRAAPRPRRRLPRCARAPRRASHAMLDADTYVAPASVDAARRAAGGAIALVDALLGAGEGEPRQGVALLRPPGHHATRDQGDGLLPPEQRRRRRRRRARGGLGARRDRRLGRAPRQRHAGHLLDATAACSTSRCTSRRSTRARAPRASWARAPAAAAPSTCPSRRAATTPSTGSPSTEVVLPALRALRARARPRLGGLRRPRARPAGLDAADGGRLRLDGPRAARGRRRERGRPPRAAARGRLRSRWRSRGRCARPCAARSAGRWTR